MRTQILRGSKEEIAETLVRLNGEVREAIIFLEDLESLDSQSASADSEEFFAEIRPSMVDAAEIDDSREAIDSRAVGE